MVAPVGEEATGVNEQEKRERQLSVGGGRKEAMWVVGCEDGVQTNVGDVHLTTTDTVVIEPVGVGIQMYRQRLFFASIGWNLDRHYTGMKAVCMQMEWSHSAE